MTKIFLLKFLFNFLVQNIILIPCSRGKYFYGWSSYLVLILMKFSVEHLTSIFITFTAYLTLILITCYYCYFLCLFSFMIFFCHLIIVKNYILWTIKLFGVFCKNDLSSKFKYSLNIITILLLLRTFKIHISEYMQKSSWQNKY